ncbi:MAG: winged helix-turn-helix domain-containing protein [Tabrizicola sp.]|uniref:winged helix-turn-helix domain-containing protein n=1 Tax=Tabrizicola sp. TaxID=2005166 RepID=UPI002ABB652C|nr:winged helix-turn-helix domain-containing protein [Tabrizicola sp.]MDZ4088490.1 winged helix-turn-helix domain-containing protein [Tabrizicola sp.]
MPASQVSSADATAFRFAGYTLDLRQGRLLGASGEIQLRPKPFALLGYMVRHAGRVLSKAELLEAVWPDVIVTEESLSQCVHALRDGLGKAGSDLVKTVPRRGYLFDLPLSAAAQAGAVAGPTAGDPAILTPRQSSIAVLPFSAGPGVSPQDRLWFDAVVNDVISQLARLRSFDVIARGSTFALRHLASDVRRAGQKLGADYVFAGSVMPQAKGIRLQMDLVRTDVGSILWTEQIELGRAGFLELVGALVDRITVAVVTEVTTAERNRARLVPDQSLTAWQAFHRGQEAFGTNTQPSLMQARAYFTRATELDPGFVRAFAALSECQATLARSPYCTDATAEAAAARRTAELAMRLDEAAPSAQFAYAHARWLHGEPDIALLHARQSVALSPSFAEGFAEIGFYEALYGQPKEAFANLARAELLNPFSPFIDSIQIDRAVAHLQSNDLDAAAMWATRAISRRESYPQMQITGALVLAAAGHRGAAEVILSTLNDQDAAFDPLKIFKPPFSLAGPAKDLLLRAVTDLGL